MPGSDRKTITILKALLEAEDGFVSGNRLANELGLSRVSIWSRMEKLRDQGFEFEAVTRKGYRIVKKPEALSSWLTRAYLEDSTIDYELVFLSSIDSTNDHATRLLANDFEAPFFVIANEQTLGRGRMGRQWYSPPSYNLYLSFASTPNVRPDRMQLFTLWMGACIAQHLRNRLNLDIGIKWPNDLYFDQKKLAGMLTEARVDADSIRELVFGLGLNVNQVQDDWPADLKQSAISLREPYGRKLDLNRMAAQLISAISTGYETFISDNIRNDFEDLWPQLDVLQGQFIEAESRDGPVEGIASGLDNHGSLIVKTNKGKLVTLNSGEVHLKRF
ncbi:MAG: biotin--[acetyl-CoA-carboxylase] ligase [Opitutaceae bacterium]|nr:biotin--[acetyl-CoA-carboxylase] ligase [Opitutaceae bacterium]